MWRHSFSHFPLSSRNNAFWVHEINTIKQKKNEINTWLTIKNYQDLTIVLIEQHYTVICREKRNITKCERVCVCIYTIHFTYGTLGLLNLKSRSKPDMWCCETTDLGECVLHNYQNTFSCGQIFCLFLPQLF